VELWVGTKKYDKHLVVNPIRELSELARGGDNLRRKFVELSLCGETSHFSHENLAVLEVTKTGL
jgi:hypothetical protein